MFSILRCQVSRIILGNVSKHAKHVSPLSTFLSKQIDEVIRCDKHTVLVHPKLQQIRFKSKKKKSKEVEEETESEDDNNENEEPVDKHTKVLNVSVNSMRLDLILKSGLGMARNKVETLFYESKIRLNGKKVIKKSESVDAGDEIDVIKGTALNNPDFLTVARVEIISLKPKSESISVKLRRIKSLTIENYEDKWKPS